MNRSGRSSKTRSWRCRCCAQSCTRCRWRSSRPLSPRSARCRSARALAIPFQSYHNHTINVRSARALAPRRSEHTTTRTRAAHRPPRVCVWRRPPCLIIPHLNPRTRDAPTTGSDPTLRSTACSPARSKKREKMDARYHNVNIRRAHRPDRAHHPAVHRPRRAGALIN